MYVSTRRAVAVHRPARALGSVWSCLSDRTCNPATVAIDYWTGMKPKTVPSTPSLVPPPEVQPSRSITDWLLEAWTGKPAQSVIDANTQTCINNTKYIRSVAAITGAVVPANAEQLCATDQQAYLRYSGGTAQQNLGTSSVKYGTWIVVGIAGLVAIYLVTRS